MAAPRTNSTSTNSKDCHGRTRGDLQQRGVLRRKGRVAGIIRRLSISAKNEASGGWRPAWPRSKPPWTPSTTAYWSSTKPGGPPPPTGAFTRCGDSRRPGGGGPAVTGRAGAPPARRPAAVFGQSAGQRRQFRDHSRDTLHLRDGRVFTCVSHPQRMGDQVVGRVWSFLDVTEQHRARRQIVELSEEITRNWSVRNSSGRNSIRFWRRFPIWSG